MSLLEVLQRTPGEIISKICSLQLSKTSKNIRNIIKENKIKIPICINFTNITDSIQDLFDILETVPEKSIFNIVRININTNYYYTIKEKDAIYLAEIIKNNTELEYFGMTRCGIDVHTVSILMLSLVKCQKLIEINFAENDISAQNPYFKKFIEDISKCINIKKINLDHNQICTYHNHIILKELLPLCEISVKELPRIFNNLIFKLNYVPYFSDKLEDEIVVLSDNTLEPAIGETIPIGKMTNEIINLKLYDTTLKKLSKKAQSSYHKKYNKYQNKNFKSLHNHKYR